MAAIAIADRLVGPGHPTFIVAEMSCNHGQDLAKALAIVRAAKDAGADAVKIQAYRPESLTLDCESEPFQVQYGPWTGRTLWQLYSEGAMPWDWLPMLKAEADRLNLILFPSVFAVEDIPKLIVIDPPVWKIASFEVTAISLLRAIAEIGKPIILSLGMATRQEWHDAELAMCRAPIIALRCTSAYPAPIGDANLKTLSDMQKYRAYVGLSDHSQNNALVAAAVALGACMVERHLTLRRSDGGPDAAFSDEPNEFAAMVRAIREAEAALGTVNYGPTESEKPMLRFRRSLWAARDIAVGEPLTAQNIAILRPVDGLPPGEWENVIGKRARVAIVRGTALQWAMIG